MQLVYGRLIGHDNQDLEMNQQRRRQFPSHLVHLDTLTELPWLHISLKGEGKKKKKKKKKKEREKKENNLGQDWR